MRVISLFYACYVVVHCRCSHRCIPRSVVAVVLALSVIVSSATDPPHPPSPRLSPTIALWASRGRRKRRLALTEHLEH